MIKILKNEVITHEQFILRAIQFKTHVDVPHKYLLNISRTLSLNCSTVSIAWGLLNDSYLTSESLSYPPSVLSCACLHIAIQCMNNPIDALQSNTNSTILNFFQSNQSSTSSPSWWNLLGIEDQQFWMAVNCIATLQCSMIEEEEEETVNSNINHNINNNTNNNNNNVKENETIDIVSENHQIIDHNNS